MRTELSIFLFCVLFFFYKGSAQECLSYEFYNKTECLGIGLVKIEKQLITVKNQGLSKHIEEDMYNPKHIVPLFFKPDYDIFYMVCLERQKANYKVLSATGDIYFVPKAEAEVKTKIAGGKVGVDYDSLMNSSLCNYLKMERTQTFDPEKRPYIPKDVVWFPSEFSWQRLAQQRLNGNFLSHDEVLSSSQTQTLDRNEILDVNAELKMLFTSVKAGVHYQEEKEIKQNRDFSCRISVKFKPMNEFPEETEIIDITAEKVIQTPIQLPAPNDNEARYLEEIYFMLEDNGVIDDRERMILERLRERYNITPERAKELEAQAIAGQELTSEEQEYLSEYKNSLQDGAISERERRLLNRLAMALGISEERVKELEGNL